MLNPHQPHAILHEATDAATAATTSASTITTKLLCARPTDTSRTPTCLQRRQAEQCREDEVLPHAQRIALLAQQQPTKLADVDEVTVESSVKITSGLLRDFFVPKCQ